MGDIDINKANLLASAISSFATFCTMFLVLLTLAEMAKQRKSAYRPDIVVEPSHYYIHATAEAGHITSMRMSADEPADNKSDNAHFDRITLQGFNVGLGTAKSVKVSWEYNLDELVNEVEERNTVRSFNLKRPTPGTISLEIPQDRIGTTMNISHEFEDFGYILPTHVKNEATLINLPYPYLMFSSALLCLWWLRDENWIEDPQFFPLEMKLTYRDIGNNEHKKSFQIKPFVYYGQFTEPKGKMKSKGLQVKIGFKVIDAK